MKKKIDGVRGVVHSTASSDDVCRVFRTCVWLIHNSDARFDVGGWRLRLWLGVGCRRVFLIRPGLRSGAVVAGAGAGAAGVLGAPRVGLLLI